MNKVIIVTGTRADYGIYKPVADVFIKNNWNISFLACGMHLSHEYGYSISDIEKDGYTIIEKVDSLFLENTKENMAKSTALELQDFTKVFSKENPDFVFLLGDRGEMLAASISCLYLGIKTVHLHGGEVSGTVDESIRHAVSKLSSIHCVSTTGSKKRLEAMGEDSWRVFQVGAPRIDTILNKELPSFEIIKNKYLLEANEKEYGLLIFHPVVTEIEEIETQTKILLEALSETDNKIICILPNADAGSTHIRKIYNSLNFENFEFVTNFHPDEYLTVLKNSKFLIGNSSSGIIEAASFQIPVINIGTRQNGRERSNNVIDVDVIYKEIKSALDTIESPQFLEKLQNTINIYGNGTASQKIFEVVNTISKDTDDKKWIQKQITY